MNRRTVILALALMCGAIGAYASWPRQADLRGFEPAEIARLETAMWRDYYDKRYPALFYHLYELSRTQFGFSPLDSFRIALAAAQAAKAFQPTRSREAADAALPPLVTYYRLLASAAPGGFDVAEAARLELDWWQARREAVGPGQYGVTVARVAAITYGKRADDPSLRDIRHRPRRGDGLSRRARAGDDGSGLVRDRVPVAAGVPVAEGGGGRRRSVKARRRQAGAAPADNKKAPPDDAGAFELLI